MEELQYVVRDLTKTEGHWLCEGLPGTAETGQPHTGGAGQTRLHRGHCIVRLMSVSNRPYLDDPRSG